MNLQVHEEFTNISVDIYDRVEGSIRGEMAVTCCFSLALCYFTLISMRFIIRDFVELVFVCETDY